MIGIKVLPLGLGYEPKLGAIYEYRKEMILENYYSGIARFVDYCDYPFVGIIRKSDVFSLKPFDYIGPPFLETAASAFDQDNVMVGGVPGEAFIGIGEFDAKTHENPYYPKPPDPVDPTDPEDPVDPSDPVDLPVGFFCNGDIDASTVDTHEWDWTEEEKLSQKAYNDIDLTGLFWEDKNSLVRLAEESLESSGGLQNSSVVQIKDFHTFLFHLRQEVVAGRIDLTGVTYDQFIAWAERTKALDCLGALELMSVYYTGRIGVVCLFHMSSMGYGIGDVATLITEYFGRLPRRTVQWIDFNDVAKDSPDPNEPYTGAFFTRFGMETISGFINMEPQALNHQVMFQAFNPHDYQNDNAEEPEREFWGTWYGHDLVDWSSHTIDGFDESSINQRKAMAATETAIHEHGHSVDFYPLLSGGVPLSETKEWLDIGGWDLDPDSRVFLVKNKPSTETGGLPKTNEGKEAPVSDYGCSAAAEDFAEAYSTYIINPAFMKSKYPERFAFMDKHVKPFIETGKNTKMVKQFLKYEKQPLILNSNVFQPIIELNKNMFSDMKNGSDPLNPMPTAFDVEYLPADGKVKATPHFIMYETRGRFPYVPHQIGTYSEYEFSNKTGIRAASDHTGKITASPVLIGHHHENERGFLRNMFVATKHAKNHKKVLVKDKTIHEHEADYMYLDLLDTTVDTFEQSNRVIRGIIMKMQSASAEGGTIIFKFVGRYSEETPFLKIADDVIFHPVETAEYTADTLVFSNIDGQDKYYGLLAESEITQRITLGEETDDLEQGVFKYQQVLGKYEIELFDVTNAVTMEKFRVTDKAFMKFTPDKQIKSPHYGVDGDFRIWELVSPSTPIHMFRSDFDYEKQNFTTDKVQHVKLDYEVLLPSEITFRFIGTSSANSTGIKMREDEVHTLHGITRTLTEDEKVFVVDGVTYVHYGDEEYTIDPVSGVTEHLRTFTYKAIECDFTVICLDEDNPNRDPLKVIKIHNAPSMEVDEGALLTPMPYLLANTGYYKLSKPTPEKIALTCGINGEDVEHIVYYKLIERNHHVDLLDYVTEELLDFSEVEPPNKVPNNQFNHFGSYIGEAFPELIVAHENLAYVAEPHGQTLQFYMFADSEEDWSREITYQRTVTNPQLTLHVDRLSCNYIDGTTFVLVDEDNKILMYFRTAKSGHVLKVAPPEDQLEFGLKIDVEMVEGNPTTVKAIGMTVDISDQTRPNRVLKVYGYNSLDNPHTTCEIVNLSYMISSGLVKKHYKNYHFPRIRSFDGQSPTEYDFTGRDLDLGETIVLPAHSDTIAGHGPVELEPVAILDTSKTRTSEAITLIHKSYRPDLLPE